MASKSISSKTIVRMELAGSEIPIKKGTANFEKDLQDATGSTSGGWKEYVVGNRGMTWTADGDVKKDTAQRVLNDTKAIDIPANPDDEEVSFKLYFSDGGGVQGKAFIKTTMNGDPQTGTPVGWTMNGTANGPVTTF
ncbi:MAG: hypothetical protein JSS51_04420 [Planctomycetes bacterium]|nr:hypothetical protein [Planctomycetota bacterium]